MEHPNPVRRLERGERPSVTRREMRILESEEIEQLLTAASDGYRPLLATAVFTGLRVSELLGLVWRDLDLKSGTLRVRYQLSRERERVEPKTPQAAREVVLMPSFVSVLREHKAASPNKEGRRLRLLNAGGKAARPSYGFPRARAGREARQARRR